MNDNLIQQLRALDDLHRAGSLSDAEFEAVKAQLLGISAQKQAAGIASTPAQFPSLLLLQGELARIDREWESEREKYKVVGRYNSSIPNSGEGTSASIVGTLFCGAWTVGALFMAINSSSPGSPSMGMPFSLFVWFFPLFGLFGIWGMLSKGAEMNEKAEAYLVAERKYQERRAQVLAKMRALETQ